MLLLLASALRLRPPSFRSFSGKPDAGFTLLELLASISIIAVLGGLVIGMGHRAVEASHAARAKAELATVATALEQYRQICGDYPQTDNASRLLQSLIGRRGPLNDTIAIRNLIEIGKFTTEADRDPLVDSSAVMVDPWGEPYRYAYKTQAPWSNSSYVLYSTGPDHRDSGVLSTGGFIDASPTENADNLHANQF